MNMKEHVSKRSIRASVRSLTALMWLLYVLWLPIHLFSSHHCFESSGETTHQSQSDKHHEDHHHDHDGNDGSVPHYASDHNLNFTIQKSLSNFKIDLVVAAVWNTAPSFGPKLDEAMPVLIDTRPVSGAPPTLQDSRAPPSI